MPPKILQNKFSWNWIETWNLRDFNNAKISQYTVVQESVELPYSPRDISVEVTHTSVCASFNSRMLQSPHQEWEVQRVVLFKQKSESLGS